MKIEIDISTHLKELLNRNNIQVHSLETVDAALREAYAVGAKKAFILHRSKIYERRVTFSSHQEVLVQDADLSPHLKIGERILVVLGTNTKSRYVLQTVVEQLFHDRFALRVQDPRHDQRFDVGKIEQTAYWPMPSEVYLKLQSDQVVLIRNVGGPITARPADLSSGERPDSPSVIKESLADRVTRQPDTNLETAFSGTGTAARGVVDISLGGLCLAVDRGQGQDLSRQLLYVRLNLPASHSGIYGAGLNIAAFTIVRSWKEAGDVDHLHLMFLSRLPELVVGFFSA